LQVGKTKTLKVKNNKKNQNVTWKSSKKSIATVTQKGKVTAKKVGKTTITATIKKKKLTCKVTVTQREEVQETPLVDETVPVSSANPITTILPVATTAPDMGAVVQTAFPAPTQTASPVPTQTASPMPTDDTTENVQETTESADDAGAGMYQEE
jgi:hypothetical protein